MTVSIPESVTAEGNVKVIFVPALADPAEPKLTELNAATAVDISCFMMPDWDGANAEQSTGEDRRWCSKESFDRLGRIKWSIAPLTYTYLPQGLPSLPGNKAYAGLTQGNTGFVVVVYGVDAQAPLSVADIADVLPVECGVQNKNAKGADEFAPLTVTQTLGVTGSVHQNKAIAA